MRNLTDRKKIIRRLVSYKMTARKTDAQLPSPKRTCIDRDEVLSKLQDAMWTLVAIRDELQEEVAEDANDLYEAEGKGTVWSAEARPGDKVFKITADLISVAEEIPLLLEELEKV